MPVGLVGLKRYEQEGERWDVKLSADLVLLELIGAVITVLLLRAPDGRGARQVRRTYDLPITVGVLGRFVWNRRSLR